MKVLKIIIQSILNFVLFNLIVLFVLSINLKSIIMNDIVKEIVKDRLVNSNIEGFIPISNSKQLLIDLVEKDSTEELINKYSEKIIKSFYDDNTPTINIEEDLITFINNNKEEIDSQIGEFQTYVALISLEDLKIHRNISTQIEQSIEVTKNNLTAQEKLVLKIYKLINTNDFHNILIILLIVNTILVLLLSKSLYSTIELISTDIILSGLTIVIIILASTKLIQNKTNISLSLTNTNLFKTGIILIVIGIIILIMNIIIKNIIKKIKSKK